MTLSSIALIYLLAAAAAPAQTPWPALASELRVLLQQKRFGELEKAIIGSQERFERSETTEDEPWATMGAFLPNDEPTANALSEWVTQNPRSYAAVAVRGLYYESTGWSVRGTKWIQETPSGQVRRMNAMHASAETDCETALAASPRLVACHVSLINIAKAGADSVRAQRYYERARQVLPMSVLVATARLQSLAPRWGGSYEEMEAFLRNLAKDAIAHAPGGRSLMGAVKAEQAAMAAIKTDYVKAIELYTEAITHGGGTAGYYASRGANAQRLGRNADALSDFNGAIEMSPRGWPYSEHKLPLVLASRAGIRYADKQQAGAEADIRDAMMLDPRDTYVSAWAKTILYRSGGQ